LRLGAQRPLRVDIAIVELDFRVVALRLHGTATTGTGGAGHAAFPGFASRASSAHAAFAGFASRASSARAAITGFAS